MVADLFLKLKKLIARYSKEEKALILKAYSFANQKHGEQKRKNGDEYITHPLSTAIMLAERQFDVETICAGLLHDVVEDTETTEKEIEKEFGGKIAKIVTGVSKISNLKTREQTLNFTNDDEYFLRLDSYRKLLMATAADIRVVIVKFFDRIHNLENIKWLESHKQQFYAKESIEIYAQIAERIGLFEAKNKLEDLAFPIAYPTEFKKFNEIKKKIPKAPDNFIEDTVKDLNKLLKDNQIAALNVYGRIKHDYSLYKKLISLSATNFDSIFDLYAFRIIVTEIADCYKVLGIIHASYDLIPGRIFDTIAKPKENGYQSLHTTVKDKNGIIYEIQIRTEKMHQVAEFGPAAHWHYKELINTKNEHIIKQSSLEWQEELSKISKEKNPTRFLESLKNNIFAEKIFVFSPKGEIIKLPAGSTPIDFAFQIHTDLGFSVSGARVNDRIEPISAKLKNGDTVEIITTQRPRVSIDWLRMSKTAGAKQKIRQYLREQNRDNLINDGKELFLGYLNEYNLAPLDEKAINDRLAESRLPYNHLNDALIALAEKSLPKISLLKALYPTLNTTQKIKLKISSVETEHDSLSGIKHDYAGCCKSKKKENVIGYVTSEHIIKIHDQNCRFIKKADKNRLIDL